MEWNGFVCFTVGEENYREPTKQQQFHQKYSIHVKLMPNNGQQLRSARDKVGLFWWAVQNLGQIFHVFCEEETPQLLPENKERTARIQLDRWHLLFGDAELHEPLYHEFAE